MERPKNGSWSKNLRENSKKWEFTPALLSKSQRKDPIESIDFVCGWFTLFEVRDNLHDLFQAAMGSSHWKDDAPKDKQEKMFFLDELIQLIESAYHLNKMVIEDRLTYSIRRKD